MRGLLGECTRYIWLPEDWAVLLPSLVYLGNSIRRVVRWLRRTAACVLLPLNVLIKPDSDAAANWIPCQQAIITNWADWCIECVVRWLRRTTAFISLSPGDFKKENPSAAFSIPRQRYYARSQMTTTNGSVHIIISEWFENTEHSSVVCSIPWQQY